MKFLYGECSKEDGICQGIPSFLIRMVQDLREKTTSNTELTTLRNKEYVYS